MTIHQTFKGFTEGQTQSINSLPEKVSIFRIGTFSKVRLIAIYQSKTQNKSRIFIRINGIIPAEN
jgi:hypothetical protein